MTLPRFLLLLSLIAAPVLADEPVTPTEKIALFNGSDLTGWIRFAPGGDIEKMWSVRDGVIHCTGKPHGYIRTEKTYRDYQLRLDWRWVETPTNSGVLLHKTGEDKIWPTCVEAQLMHENAGDFWILQGATIKVKDQKVGPGAYVNSKKFAPHSEKPAGEWNHYDIECRGGTVKLTVNGVLQNEGVDASASAGYICLQSEGSPIEFRNVELLPLK